MYFGLIVFVVLWGTTDSKYITPSTPREKDSPLS